jgi:hypothetical protein
MMPLFHEVAQLRRILQPVEKLLHAHLGALIEDSAPQFCSVLAVFFERIDAIRSIGRSDSDFFNRLGYSANFAVTAFYEVRCPEFAPGFGRCHH